MCGCLAIILCMWKATHLGISHNCYLPNFSYLLHHYKYVCVCTSLCYGQYKLRGNKRGQTYMLFLISEHVQGWRGSKNQPFDPLTPLVSIQYKPLILIWIVIKRQASTQAQFEHDAAWFMMNIWMYTGYKSWNAALVRARANILIYILNWRVFFGDGLFCWNERKKQAAN